MDLSAHVDCNVHRRRNVNNLQFTAFAYDAWHLVSDVSGFGMDPATVTAFEVGGKMRCKNYLDIP